MADMLLLAPSLRWRRYTVWVLAAWLCVVAAGVGAPLARAHLALGSLERLCSGDSAPHWVPSPASTAAADVSAALHHLIDCPLCMPVLAPPPALQAASVQAAAPDRPVDWAWVPVPARWTYGPLARGPPG
ncbi:hypothetical protein [Comamonas aquatica]|jgi:hypothetical protein|uniref:DUF2946 domain-containing protein n=2 Tax=Comamonas aquatica TaxID=225991 RepID=A0AA35D5Q0_9BURK|nr:hypothetical protein [Comamonas aquatica]CAB5659384.1 Uncharacterised protein [Comamonas aquatica]CAB5676833.1 Uncharacterised protein [Comamonas aquatica]CAC9181389.1 Uncharacterised protein [Comamonas aquatica]CAC9678493.1 Uncharacterised protein [Comamonas aquatica]